jgi:hypothetical protein
MRIGKWRRDDFGREPGHLVRGQRGSEHGKKKYGSTGKATLGTKSFNGQGQRYASRLTFQHAISVP